MREPKGTEYEEARGHPLEDDLPCYREKEVAVTNYPVYMHKMGLATDHTGCLWNDGSNTCNHPGESMAPLEDDDEEEAKG